MCKNFPVLPIKVTITFAENHCQAALSREVGLVYNTIVYLLYILLSSLPPTFLQTHPVCICPSRYFENTVLLANAWGISSLELLLAVSLLHMSLFYF